MRCTVMESETISKFSRNDHETKVTFYKNLIMKKHGHQGARLIAVTEILKIFSEMADQKSK